VLTIKRHPLSLKAATLGTVAFIVGLTGAVAYVDRFRQHENLVFSQEETISNTADTLPTGEDRSASATQNTVSSQATASPQAASTPTIAAPSSATGSVAPAPSSVSAAPTTSTFEPGRGAGAPAPSSGTTDPSPSTTPLSPVTDSCLLQNCIPTTLQNATNSLLGQ
jgi:hypothetical protein